MSHLLRAKAYGTKTASLVGNYSLEMASDSVRHGLLVPSYLKE